MTAVTADTAPTRTAPSAAADRLSWLRERGMGASILVAAISSAFGVLLISATGWIGAWLESDPYLRGGEVLTFVVGHSQRVAGGRGGLCRGHRHGQHLLDDRRGRTRRIALLRLIGASSRAQRQEIARQGLIVGGIGAVLGLLLGTALAWGLLVGGEALLGESVGYGVVQPVLVVPAAVVALTTWGAAWAGSRRVLTVTPLQALSGSVERAHDEVVRRGGRNAASIVLFIAGALLLTAGILVGMVTPLGVVIAFFGGLLSFTALALGAVVVMPPILRLTGGLFGRSAPARLAAQNALRYPERSSRMAIGVVMGVTLVTMSGRGPRGVDGVADAGSTEGFAVRRRA